MTTFPDPANARIPGMIKSERRPGLIEAAEDVTVFLKPLIKSNKIEVGEFTYYNDTENAAGFEDNNVLYAYGPERLVIGKFCCLAMGTKFIMSPGTDYHMPGGTTSYPFFIFGGSWLEKTADLLPNLPSKGDIVVGNDVWIGREAVIMPGVTIGDGAVIGARSLVTSDVAPYSVVGGNPAKEIKKRLSDEDIDRMLRIAWWNWPAEVVTEHVRTIWSATPSDLEELAKKIGHLGG
ncbi:MULTISPECIES: CatB-related O-acetyltransferase [Streptomyces phaeochromogenes group]|uniref:CatB-related O-acetyltransferase n=1 Tax=Streptomyces phaeochromogenes group TaxID=2838332 RepID=UPI00340832E6|nr:CatB-related O-acetyltransferase [Streptomyces phaeochromogenes]